MWHCVTPLKMALELVLKSLLSSTKFVNSSAEEKDWIAVAKLIPGATPKQVCWAIEFPFNLHIY